MTAAKWEPHFLSFGNWAVQRGDEIARNEHGEVRSFAHERSARVVADKLNRTPG